MKNYANAPSILDRVKFVMKNYANGPSILERVKFAMKNYANGLSMIIEGVLTAGSVRRLGVLAMCLASARLAGSNVKCSAELNNKESQI